MNGEIVIDKEVFDQMYDAHNPLPDKQDYEALEKYYKNKNFVYKEVQKTINKKYKEKFHKYMNKLNQYDFDRVIKDDEWTSINVGEKTKADLETLYIEYKKFVIDKKQEVTCKNVNEYLKQWVLRLIYNDLLSNQDFPGEPHTSFAIDEPETYLNYIKKAMETSDNSGEPVSLPVQKSTREVLDRLRDITFLETYDQAVIYLLNLVHSKKYRTYLTSLEKMRKIADNNEQYKNYFDDKSGDFDEKILLENMPKIRDVDDFIIDYIHLLKIKEAKK